MAEYVKVPARCLHHVPDSLPFELACLTEPHSVAYNAMCGNAEIKPGDLVVVLGPGPIGLLCARMAALSGAYPLVVAGLAGDAARLKTARELGATHTVNIQEQPLEDVIRDLSPIGADVVCDASGASRPLDAALKLARPDGQVVKVGWSPDQIPIDLNPLVLKNVRLQGSFSHNYPIWERVIGLIAAGLTKADLIVGLKADLPGGTTPSRPCTTGRSSSQCSCRGSGHRRAHRPSASRRLAPSAVRARFARAEERRDVEQTGRSGHRIDVRNRARDRDSICGAGRDGGCPRSRRGRRAATRSTRSRAAEARRAWHRADLADAAACRGLIEFAQTTFGGPRHPR